MSAAESSLLHHPLEGGIPPAWASAWGDSQWGPWAAFEIGGVEQRMQWIPPGTFWMGSPEHEPGRDDDETRHRVTLSEGYWMAQTQCTQALWVAVMGDNPSRFEDPQRPVERVSWDDVQTFLERVEGRQPGLALRLPTEAQWEYACRAGTETATYAGPLDILGLNHAPVLDAIAWYGGNSGYDLDLDLDQAEDSSGWEEKQYENRRAATRRVGERRCNPWGLYDTLGNVREWCADGTRTYEAEHVHDPIGSMDMGSQRVIRGGSWGGVAEDVRAACRSAALPSYRGDVFLGFRVSRGPGAPGRLPEGSGGSPRR